MHLTSQDAGVDDARWVDGLKNRDEATFVRLVETYQGPLLRLALTYADSRAIAEEIVQETWLGVLAGIDRFQGRSSFRTWLFRILVNRAQTRAEREGRTVPFSAMSPSGLDNDEPAVAPERFLPDTHPDWAGHWTAAPSSWGESPETRLLRRETLEIIGRAIAALPAGQRQVITLRDVDGLSAEEVCNVLALSETNQRVLLHRARSRVRGAVERHFTND